MEGDQPDNADAESMDSEKTEVKVFLKVLQYRLAYLWFCLKTYIIENLLLEFIDEITSLPESLKFWKENAQLYTPPKKNECRKDILTFDCCSLKKNNSLSTMISVNLFYTGYVTGWHAGNGGFWERGWGPPILPLPWLPHHLPGHACPRQVNGPDGQPRVPGRRHAQKEEKEEQVKERG